MKEWEEVFGTESEKPKEIDTQQSPTTVYQRRNIRKEIREKWDGTKIIGWLREERELTVEEYQQMTFMQQIVTESTKEIAEAVTMFQKDAVIDEYTEQLIEEGLI